MGNPVSKPETYKDAFPWNNVSKVARIEAAKVDKGVAIRVKVGMAFADTVVCRNLSVGMAKVNKAIVFDKISVSMGRIDELHCLHDAEQNVSFGSVGRTIYYTVDELVDVALGLIPNLEKVEVVDGKEEEETAKAAGIAIEENNDIKPIPVAVPV
jgi:hypothetical protein